MIEKVNISFAGCGFLGFYHIGVSSCMKEYAPHLLLNKIAGASIGAIAATCLLSDISLGTFTSEFLQIIYEVRRRTLGPFNPLVNVQKMLRNVLHRYLPKNSYKEATGRLFISMTRVLDGGNYIVSEYDSDEELIDALLASAFVPFFSGFLPPRFRGYRYMDGGFSNNLPVLDENTITVSPFCGESDICPRDTTIQLFHINLCNTSMEISKPNIDRFGRILFPPSIEILAKMCKQGFDDALAFLQRNNMISCTKCLTIQRTISLPVIKHKLAGKRHTFDPECEECTYYKEKAASSNLPETVLKNFEEAIDVANKEFTGWILRHPGIRILSILSVPYFLTIDVIRAVLRKFVEVAPDLVEILCFYSTSLLKIIINTIDKMNKTGLFLASRVFGPLSVSIYINDERNTTSRRNKVNVEFNIDPKEKFETTDENLLKETETLIVHSVERKESRKETYNHLLDVIDNHEAVMSFRYMEDSNKMNVVEFVDITNDEDILQKINENDVEIIASVVDDSETLVSHEAAAHNIANRRNVTVSFNDINVDDDVGQDLAAMDNKTDCKEMICEKRSNGDRCGSDAVNKNHCITANHKPTVNGIAHGDGTEVAVS